MIAEVDSPFAGLSVTVGADLAVSSEGPEWAEIAAWNEQQLEGIWQSLVREAEHGLQLVIESEEGLRSSTESGEKSPRTGRKRRRVNWSEPAFSRGEM